MGSRGRSIRLRIYALVAIPLVVMLGLLAYVATTSINNAKDLDRAPDLINATSLPTAHFVQYLQDERLAAIVYAFDPASPSAAANFASATAKTKADEQPFILAMNSPATKGSESGAEAQGIAAMATQLKQLPELEGAISQARVTSMEVYGAYTEAIANEPKLFLDEADTMTNATAADQALGLIGAVTAREELSQEDALLAGMLAAPKSTTAQQRALFAQARAAFDIAAATRQADVQDTDFLLTPANLAVYNAPQASTGALQQQLPKIEAAVETGKPIDKLGLTASQWETMAGTLLTTEYNGGVNDAAAQLKVDRQIAHAAWVKFWITCAIAAAALFLTLLFTTLLGRTIIRRLRGLETSALALAETQLPEVIGRLRRGDDVDVAVEAPPLRVGGDEIGRVGQAFDLVRQTAIRSAVEEAKLRRGLNDVFRSLARRSQSLLHRQLTLLDQMERRASDPEALDDLFRLDHLTTRMRRHAEGLVILAGAPPGRGWSSPVRMVDVMRGAIAEVEDYARVSVATRSQAALSGSAVADVIHLLAELIENATTLSPPYTSVRVSGETVANGFAIEIEDRGLGISAQRLAELNDRLTNPPEFNPSDSEQLGLFVVSQLARRHGIRVTLKASPYGGTDAVVLIPRHLVVAEEAVRASLPGEQAAAITASPLAANGNHFATAQVSDLSSFPGDPGLSVPGLSGSGSYDSGPADNPVFASGLTLPGSSVPLDGSMASDGADFTSGPEFSGGSEFSGGPRIAGPLRRSQETFSDGQPRGGHHAPPRGSGANGGSAPVVSNGNGHGSGNGFASDLTTGAGLASDPGELPRRRRGLPGRDGVNQPQSGPQTPDFDAFTMQQPGSDDRFHGTAPAPQDTAVPPVPTGSFGSAPAPYSFPAQPPAFPAQPPAVPAWPAQAPATPMTDVAPGSPKMSRPPWELSHDTGPQPVVPAEAGPELANGPGQADGDFDALPRRTKQASIAPQLRGDPAARQSAPVAEPSSNGPAAWTSPDDMRATMSALQRGWQEGRSQLGPGGQPPWEQEADSDSDAT